MPAVRAVTADVPPEEEVEKLFGHVIEHHQRLDIVANVAGVIALEPIETTTFEIWDWTLGVILRGTFLFARAEVPIFSERSHSPHVSCAD